MCVAIANGNCPGKKTWTCDVNFEKNLPSWMQSKQNPLTNENIYTFDKILFIFLVEFKVISGESNLNEARIKFIQFHISSI